MKLQMRSAQLKKNSNIKKRKLALAANTTTICDDNSASSNTFIGKT